MPEISCPCGRPQPVDSCCGAIHRGRRPAVTAEDLMRSRYSAFAAADEGYLRRSWDPETCPRTIHVSDDRRWTGLEIHATTGGAAFDQTGTVHFTASFDEGGSPGSQSENSLFRRVDGVWVYVGAAD